MRAKIISLAKRAFPLMSGKQRAEAIRLIGQLEQTENAGSDLMDQYARRAQKAFESDVQPLVSAIVATLHSSAGKAKKTPTWFPGSAARLGVAKESLLSLQRLLPGIMRHVNEKPSLAGVIEEAMVHAFYSAFFQESPAEFDRLSTSNAGDVGNIIFSEEPVVSDAMKQWNSRSVFETDLSSGELRAFSSQLKNRSVFSARTTNARYLQKVHEVVGDVLAGKVDMAKARVTLMRELKLLGYDPAVGFPQDMATIPPAEKGSLQDLSSFRRINLLLETNVRMARGYAQMLAGESSYNKEAYPAWELVRLYIRRVERGTPESKTAGWQKRWEDAGKAVRWEGASQSALVALKNSPIWAAIGDGEGGYIDTFGNPFPPFAFGSGMAWAAVSREKTIDLGLIAKEKTKTHPASPATLTPGQKETARILSEMPPELREELERELGL